jgi:glycosyltransferase involved in cell wall biosynthesis
VRIAVLGTRGIPNRYGGFEQCAENLSLKWTRLGHEVTVYNPDDHPNKDGKWNDIHIKHIYSNEKTFGVIGSIIFDYLCLKDVSNHDYDILLELGCSASMFYPSQKNRNSRIITNMDGLEWKRSKWNNLSQMYLKYLERKAVLRSDALIADNLGIRDYLQKSYNATSSYIPYGATIFENFNEEKIERYNLKPFAYYILVARLEPENNIEMILDGYIQSSSKNPFVVVGNYKTKYGNYLVNKFDNKQSIKFIGHIYNYDILDNLRYFSKIYFHGHSVGGTNPSLLEAMGCSCNVASHDNPFNRYVLGDNAFYFTNSNDVSNIICNDEYKSEYIDDNKMKIKYAYSWDLISKQYLEVFMEALTY